jgi:uncharacterized repeat protein (TIGR03803 family)
LIPSPGGWTQKELHSFHGDGAAPMGGVVMDSSGNLYGTTFWGGLYDGGTVFELIPQEDGSWLSKILYSFNPQSGGHFPVGGLILDESGNLYGTTSQVGSTRFQGGTVFELSPQANGSWKASVLHNFTNTGVDGRDPQATLTRDAAGNIYGTTTYGGAYGSGNFGGTVFKLSPQADGTYTETILHSFFENSTDGYAPFYGALVLDAAGNLYGTTVVGGAYGGGIVFEITP